MWVAQLSRSDLPARLCCSFVTIFILLMKPPNLMQRSFLVAIRALMQIK